jgi:hypothetical protein
MGADGGVDDFVEAEFKKQRIKVESRISNFSERYVIF